MPRRGGSRYRQRCNMRCAGGTYNGSISILYVDGKQQGSIAPASTYPGYSNPDLFVNGTTGGGGGFYLTASEDDFRVYNRALTLGEVLRLYNLGK